MFPLSDVGILAGCRGENVVFRGGGIYWLDEVNGVVRAARNFGNSLAFATDVNFYVYDTAKETITEFVTWRAIRNIIFIEAVGHGRFFLGGGSGLLLLEKDVFTKLTFGGKGGGRVAGLVKGGKDYFVAFRKTIYRFSLLRS